MVSEPPRPSVVTSFDGRDALEAGDEHDRVLVERVHDPVGAHVEDPRLRVRRVGDDAGLRAGQRDRAVPEVVDRHRAERAGHPLAGREQHVHLARVAGSSETSNASGDQAVGLQAARAEHRDHAVALLALGDDARGRALEALRVGDRCAAELHDDRAQAHARPRRIRADAPRAVPRGLYGDRVRLLTRIAVDTTPLRESRDLRLLLLGNVVTGLGTQATLVALPYQLYVETQSAFLVGLLGAAELIPLVTLALLGRRAGRPLRPPPAAAARPDRARRTRGGARRAGVRGLTAGRAPLPAGRAARGLRRAAERDAQLDRAEPRRARAAAVGPGPELRAVPAHARDRPRDRGRADRRRRAGLGLLAGRASRAWRSCGRSCG